MLPLRSLLLVGASVYLADPGDPLHVLRATPTRQAGPAAVVTVSFDRPVAGSLDRTVDARDIFRIEPQVSGKVEWRDPITVRFTPADLLSPGTTYTVTIASTFEAMDGSRLAQPYQFTFQVRGPEVLTSSLGGRLSRFLASNATMELVASAPVDPEVVNRLAYLEFEPTCSSRVVRLKVSGQREIREDDTWEYREAGGWERNRAVDRLRRVVALTPVTPLPHGCSGELVTPEILDQGTQDSTPRRYALATYGDLRLDRAACAWDECPTGPIEVKFTTPIRGAELMRHLRLQPAVPFAVSDTEDERSTWVLDATLNPRTGYALVADTALRDIFGQRLTGNPVSAFFTSGYPPTVDYTYGKLVVERLGYRTLAVRHVNVDTLVATIAPVPDSLVAEFLARSQWGWDDLWPRIQAGATRKRYSVPNQKDHAHIFGIPLPILNAQRPGKATLLAVRISSPQLPVIPGAEPSLGPLALIQVTDLGVHARVGVQEGVVWVTGASDGRARANAQVQLRDRKGRLLASATTDSLGLARLRGYQVPPRAADGEDTGGGDLEGFVTVTAGSDRAMVGISQYDPDLSPWQFNVYSAWNEERIPMAAAVFTERGIYRPGEPVYAKAILRRGSLGALRTPARTDSLRWIFQDRDGGTLTQKTVALSPFGTADQTYRLPSDIALGDYVVAVQFKWQRAWLDIASASYRVAEYRPPEFLVGVTADSGVRYAGDKLTATVESRYLFGAPMARAAIGWTARMQPIGSWESMVPGTEGYSLGESDSWWETESRGNGVVVLASGSDTLDAAGHLAIEVPLTANMNGRAARATIEAVVTDVNRQAVGSAVSVIVHPADFYLAAKAMGTSYFWAAGTPQKIAVLATKPTGERVSNVRVRGVVVRREWHRVHRERGGVAEQIGEWVMDTVSTCNVTTAAQPVTCGFTPASGGIYVVTLRAEDAKKRPVTTSFSRWASGSDWVPWNDENQFKMDVLADRDRYAVGDTATVLFASPFTDAEAWITVEREGLIEQRRLRLTSGSTTLKFPITENFAPNAYISILVARGRSARPGPLDDPGRPTIRVGYAQLRVTPEVKRLDIAVEPVQAEYRPGDTARVRLRVRDARGGGQRSEVTLWAVDEGVLALTGYQVPDPIDLIYRERGLGLRLASNMVSVAPQVPEGEKGLRAPGGGGGAGNTDILRSRFQTTAFFLGSVVTDSLGVATARAKLPDNLTTFRVMAVAVTAGDRYGKGQSSLLVTRPLLARPSLPRFVRAGDEFVAGVVVNQRAGGTPVVTVKADASGIDLVGDRTRQSTLEAGRGREVRFDFRGRPGDSVSFRFDVTGAGDADAVQARLPVREAFRPRFHTIAGMLFDTASIEFALPADIDPERSLLALSLGASPLSVIRGAFRSMRVYPYYCTEQVSSAALPLIALFKAEKRLGAAGIAPPHAREDIALAVETLSRRQRPDGAIGYWSPSDWTTPWLSAYAGITLLEARSAGIPVSDSVLARLGTYLAGTLSGATSLGSPVSSWYDRRELSLAERVAAVDLLSRLRKPDVAAENDLLRQAAQLDWEDRVRLAEVLARRRDRRAGTALLTSALSGVRVEGRKAVIPDSLLRSFYFSSTIRPTAQLLTAVLAIDSSNAIVGPLVETLVEYGRLAQPYEWNTQDYGSIVYALAAYERRQRLGVSRGVTIQSGNHALFRVDSIAGLKDSTASLVNLLSPGNDGGKTLRLSLRAGSRGLPVYYYLTVKEIPRNRPVRPDDHGISVERWYESFPGGKPITEVTEGDLVRVRLRITVPATRHFVVLDDALPAGLEAIDLSLRTAASPGVGLTDPDLGQSDQPDEGTDNGPGYHWYYGSWDSGWWSPFEHKEMRDDRVVYSAATLWKGSYTATYVARATTPGVFVRPPAHAEEMYNPDVHGRTEGGVFTVKRRDK
ncbi:MAG: MG2 domain-containing protein [Gemmatimonadota bacterium]